MQQIHVLRCELSINIVFFLVRMSVADWTNCHRMEHRDLQLTASTPASAATPNIAMVD